jgi:hypothetical protein
MSIFIFWPTCQDLSLDIGGRICSGMGMHCIRCDGIEEAADLISRDLADKRDFMIIEGTEIKRWVDPLPWEIK